jgi:hypothetical protein
MKNKEDIKEFDTSPQPSASGDLESLIKANVSELPDDVLGEEISESDYTKLIATRAVMKRQEEDEQWKATHRNNSGRPYGIQPKMTIEEYHRRGRRRRIARASRKRQGKQSGGKKTVRARVHTGRPKHHSSKKR